jgi:hypothetical protein
MSRGKELLGIQWLGGWVDLRVSKEVAMKKETLALAGNRTFVMAKLNSSLLR